MTPRRLALLFALGSLALPMAHAGRHSSASTNPNVNLPSAPDPGPAAYELRLARYADSFGTTPTFVFFIGDIAYKSVDELKKGVAGLPPGALLQWTPAKGLYGGEPLLSNEADLKAFADYCTSLGIHFIFVPPDDQ